MACKSVHVTCPQRCRRHPEMKERRSRRDVCFRVLLLLDLLSPPRPRPHPHPHNFVINLHHLSHTQSQVEGDTQSTIPSSSANYTSITRNRHGDQNEPPLLHPALLVGPYGPSLRGALTPPTSAHEGLAPSLSRQHREQLGHTSHFILTKKLVEGVVSAPTPPIVVSMRLLFKLPIPFRSHAVTDRYVDGPRA